MSRLIIHLNLWTVVQGFFTFKPVVRTVKAISACESRGIKHTWFDGHIVSYYEPVLPFQTKTHEELLKQFGRKRPVTFNTITLATVNTLKS